MDGHTLMRSWLRCLPAAWFGICIGLIGGFWTASISVLMDLLRFDRLQFFPIPPILFAIVLFFGVMRSRLAEVNGDVVCRLVPERLCAQSAITFTAALAAFHFSHGGRSGWLAAGLSASSCTVAFATLNLRRLDIMCAGAITAAGGGCVLTPVDDLHSFFLFPAWFATTSGAYLCWITLVATEYGAGSASRLRRLSERQLAAAAPALLIAMISGAVWLVIARMK